MASPILRISPYTWAKLSFIRDLGATEVGGWCISDPESMLKVVDFQLVKHKEASAAFNELDDDANYEYLVRMGEKGMHPREFMRIWTHTHPGSGDGSATPSSYDENKFNEMTAGERFTWMIMFIISRGGKTTARLRVQTDGVILNQELQVAVDYRLPFPASDHKAWEAEYEENVKPAISSYQYKGYSQGRVQEYSRGAFSKWNSRTKQWEDSKQSTVAGHLPASAVPSRVGGDNYGDSWGSDSHWDAYMRKFCDRVDSRIPETSGNGFKTEEKEKKREETNTRQIGFQGEGKSATNSSKTIDSEAISASTEEIAENVEYYVDMIDAEIIKAGDPRIAKKDLAAYDLSAELEDYTMSEIKKILKKLKISFKEVDNYYVIYDGSPTPLLIHSDEIDLNAAQLYAKQ